MAKTNPKSDPIETTLTETNLVSTTPVETEVLLPKFYPCLCPCKCGRDSLISDRLSPVLSLHARCEPCGNKEHMKANPIAVLDTKPEESNLVSLLHKATEEELAIDKQVRDEISKELWDAQWKRWEDSLPDKFRGANTDHTMIVERLARLKEGKKGRGVASLAAFGDTGVGKTYLAISYANTAIKAGYFKPSEVLFGSESELLSAAANAPFADVETAFRRLTNGRYKMIIIDDVGRGAYLRDDMRPKIWSLILDKMYSENRVVVITSNLDPTRLTEHIGEGAMDRLRAMVGYGSLILKEPQRRKITEETLASIKKAEENKGKA